MATPKRTDDSQSAPRWASLHLWQMQPVRDVLVGLGVFALIIVGQKTSVVTVPLLLALLLAYLFEPVIVWSMGKFKISRRTSVISIIASIVLFVAIPAFIGTTYAIGQLVSFTTSSARNIDYVSKALQMDEDQARTYLINSIDPLHSSGNVPSVTDGQEVNLNTKADPWIWMENKIRTSQSEGSALGDLFTAGTDWVEQNQDRVAQTAAGVGISAVNRGLSLVGAVFGLSFMLFVTAFFFFFTSTEWIGLKRFGSSLLPDKNRDRITDLLVKFDQVISGFIRGRITIAFIQAIVFSVGYFIIGVPGAFILGPAIAILSIVPYLALIGLPISISLLWLQGHTGIRGEMWWVLGAPVALYFLGQALDDYVWTPIIQGKSTGMDTPTILFASLAGGALFGVFGLLIAIPIAACVKILIQEVFWPKFKDWAEGRASDPLPID